ncbi:MAG: helix-turn-helix transcriptional regulator, partial [Saprospiraceae bacterium]
MKIDLSSTFYLFAAAQAVVLMVVVLRKTKISLSEKYLVGVLFALSITLIHYVILMNELISNPTGWSESGALAWQTIPPLLYLYGRSLVGNEQQWRWSNLRFFPISIYFLAQTLLVAGGVYFGFFLLFSDWNSYSVAWILVYLVNSLAFALLTLRLLYQSDISDKQATELTWLRWYFQGFATILIVLTGALVYLRNAATFVQQFEYWLLIFYAVFIFGLVFKSLRSSNYLNILADDHYGHARKDQSELLELFNQLETYVQREQPYRQPKLSLSDLAKATNISENQLSQIFTRHLHASFYQYINNYRLTAFEQEVREKGTQQYTIMALAEAAGFASRATFYKAFKEKFE